MPMTVLELRKKIDQLVEDLIPLAEDHPCKDRGTEFLRVLEGAFRKNLMRLRAVNILCEHPRLAPTALEITRNMIEDVVSIEYMKLDEPNESAKRFYKFRWVQLKEDQDYADSVGLDLDEEGMPTKDEVDGEYKKAISEHPDFIGKDGKPVRSWVRRDVEAMLNRLKKKEALGDDDIRMIGRAYISGNRKTHFNPFDIMLQMSDETLDLNGEYALKTSLLVATSSTIRLATRYIDEISHINGKNTHHDIAKKANKLLTEMHALKSLDA